MCEWICNCDASNNEAIGMTLGIQILIITTSEEFLYSEYIGPCGNSNYAEAKSIIRALMKLKKLCDQNDIITIYRDNQEIINKVNNIIRHGYKKRTKKCLDILLLLPIL